MKEHESGQISYIEFKALLLDITDLKEAETY